MWKALGVPNALGFSQLGGHRHCQLPVSQYPYVTAFARRFLLDDAAAEPNVQESDGGFDKNLKPWVDWPTPSLR